MGKEKLLDLKSNHKMHPMVKRKNRKGTEVLRQWKEEMKTASFKEAEGRTSLGRAWWDCEIPLSDLISD